MFVMNLDRHWMLFYAYGDAQYVQYVAKVASTEKLAFAAPTVQWSLREKPNSPCIRL
ncbi:hypothetical protein [Desulfovibrio oxyclinae]|uniref:hypothetical protein n=1 Tax=Desulfovibrio oxyclinae TaxID=63560 RepID=UPI0003690CAD|nr:hypothetical protein [Desulfovibrio oxyclinae]